MLFVGRLSPEKNLNLLVDALQGTQCHLDIVGDDGSSDDALALKEKARQNNVDLTFRGTVPNSRLPILMNEYAIFALTSITEGNPKALLEAMACGMSVVGTDVPGIRDVIQDGMNGLLCSSTPEAVRTGINRLVSDGVLREKLGAAARAWIVTHCSLNEILETELHRYQNMTGK